MAGYLNYDTQQPDSGMLSEWVPTGDIGRLGREGHLFVTDRKKDLIIRGGVNISPRAVEDVLMRHETVLQAIVVGLPHEFYGEEVVAVVKLKEGNTLEAAQPLLVSLCKENLSAASVPTRFVLRTEFPVNTTGKIQKGKLREQLIAELATGANTHS
jgi:acyl-CoA synthetase (AMP-forming)/AMP-acid ligase II